MRVGTYTEMPLVQKVQMTDKVTDKVPKIQKVQQAAVAMSMPKGAGPTAAVAADVHGKDEFTAKQPVLEGVDLELMEHQAVGQVVGVCPRRWCKCRRISCRRQ